MTTLQNLLWKKSLNQRYKLNPNLPHKSNMLTSNSEVAPKLSLMLNPQLTYAEPWMPRLKKPNNCRLKKLLLLICQLQGQFWSQHRLIKLLISLPRMLRWRGKLLKGLRGNNVMSKRRCKPVRLQMRRTWTTSLQRRRSLKRNSASLLKPGLMPRRDEN